ncbi:hypothetical protein EUX98_g1845 [Antrodiella citrinella]|uniref:Uncharacterized protein n=1 Tax=Antrodiella citrinella TaxID=2447956 RepID=A0A4S4N1X0_9APHY|nr:hypothetical protein EUX98_g1845 [Antrodiella citrinella]
MVLTDTASLPQQHQARVGASHLRSLVRSGQVDFILSLYPQFSVESQVSMMLDFIKLNPAKFLSDNSVAGNPGPSHERISTRVEDVRTTSKTTQKSLSDQADIKRAALEAHTRPAAMPAVSSEKKPGGSSHNDRLRLRTAPKSVKPTPVMLVSNRVRLVVQQAVEIADEPVACLKLYKERCLERRLIEYSRQKVASISVEPVTYQRTDPAKLSALKPLLGSSTSPVVAVPSTKSVPGPSTVSLKERNVQQPPRRDVPAKMSKPPFQHPGAPTPYPRTHALSSVSTAPVKPVQKKFHLTIRPDSSIAPKSHVPGKRTSDVAEIGTTSSIRNNDTIEPHKKPRLQAPPPPQRSNFVDSSYKIGPPRHKRKSEPTVPLIKIGPPKKKLKKAVGPVREPLYSPTLYCLTPPSPRPFLPILPVDPVDSTLDVVEIDSEEDTLTVSLDDFEFALPSGKRNDGMLLGSPMRFTRGLVKPMDISSNSATGVSHSDPLSLEDIDSTRTPIFELFPLDMESLSDNRPEILDSPPNYAFKEPLSDREPDSPINFAFIEPPRDSDSEISPELVSSQVDPLRVSFKLHRSSKRE